MCPHLGERKALITVDWFETSVIVVVCVSLITYVHLRDQRRQSESNTEEPTADDLDVISGSLDDGDYSEPVPPVGVRLGRDAARSWDWAGWE